jgi:hypothetical protein
MSGFDLGNILTGGLGGLFDGGSSSSVTSTVNVDIQGLNNIGLNETIELKPIEIKPLKVTLDETVTIKPVTLNENIDLKPVTLNENIDLKPVTLNENVDLKPVTLNENIDLKPVAVDTCQTLRLAPLPETRVSNPYHHRVTYHLFGMEMMNISYTGESGQNVESPHHPQVVEGQRWGGGHRDEYPMIVGESPGIRVRVLRPDEE